MKTYLTLAAFETDIQSGELVIDAARFSVAAGVLWAWGSFQGGNYETVKVVLPL